MTIHMALGPQQIIRRRYDHPQLIEYEFNIHFPPDRCYSCGTYQSSLLQ